MKKIIFSLIALVSVGAASAQGFSFGPKIGVNLATIGNLENVDAKMRVGFVVGGFAEYQWSRFSVSADILYSEQGCKFDQGNTTNTQRLHYMIAPVLLNYYITGGLSVKAGIQPGVMTTARSNDGLNRSVFKGLDLAVPVGIAYSFSNGFIIDARYNIGLQDIMENPAGDTSKNDVFAFTLGWRF